MSKIGEIRNSFLKKRGGRLISIEAAILGLAILFFIVVTKEELFYAGVVVALVVGFVFPIVVGIFRTLAWLAAILFSLVWALLAFLLAGEIGDGSIVIQLLAGVLFFAISFVIHKIYSELSFREKSKSQKIQSVVADNREAGEKVKFCPKCGRRIRSADGRCSVCDKE